MCKVNNCPYNYNGKFCKKEFPSIDQNGCCSVLWRKGRQRQKISNELDKVKQINIKDAVFEEWSQQKEEERERAADAVNRSMRTNGLVRGSVQRPRAFSRIIRFFQ